MQHQILLFIISFDCLSMSFVRSGRLTFPIIKIIWYSISTTMNRNGEVAVNCVHLIPSCTAGPVMVALDWPVIVFMPFSLIDILEVWNILQSGAKILSLSGGIISSVSENVDGNTPFCFKLNFGSVTWTGFALLCLYLLTFFLFLTYFLTFFLTYLLTFCVTYFLTFCLTYFLTFFLMYLLSFNLTYLLTWSRLRSGAEHWSHMIAVEVRRGTLISQDRGWGPARNTDLTGSRLRSGAEHWSRRIAVEVRRGTLNSHDRDYTEHWRRGRGGRGGGQSSHKI